MSYHRIALHLTHTQTTLCSTTARRLMRALFLATLCARIPLVLCHVLQTHRVDIAHEDGRRNHNTRLAIVEEFLAHRLHTELLLENLPDSGGRRSLVHEGRRISNRRRRSRRLSEKGLQKLGHRHTRGNGVAVHYHVWDETRRRPRHVMATNHHADCALLAVAVGELVTQLGHSVLDGADLHKREARITNHDRNLLHATCRPDLRSHTRITNITTRALKITAN